MSTKIDKRPVVGPPGLSYMRRFVAEYEGSGQITQATLDVVHDMFVAGLEAIYAIDPVDERYSEKVEREVIKAMKIKRGEELRVGDRFLFCQYHDLQAKGLEPKEARADIIEWLHRDDWREDVEGDDRLFLLLCYEEARRELLAYLNRKSYTDETKKYTAWDEMLRQRIRRLTHEAAPEGADPKTVRTSASNFQEAIEKIVYRANADPD